MITQIYSLQTPEEARMCIEAGADRIGVAVATGCNLPSEVSEETCAQIYEQAKGKAETVLIVVTESEEPIYAPLKKLRPDVLHICGYDFQSTPEFAEKIRKLQPGIKLLQAVAVDGPGAIERAKYFAGFCDEIILDSVDPSIAGIGAAGITHDWSISAEIVKTVFCPVILAGGLSADNVAEAIKAVKPWGVDSFTKTSDKFSDGTSRKNPEKVRAFIENARKAFSELKQE